MLSFFWECAENVNNEGLDNIQFFWSSLGQTGNWGKWHSENSPGRTQTHDATAMMRRLLTQACYSCAWVICVCTEGLRAENSFYSYLRGRLDREDQLWPEVPGERHGWGSLLQGKTKQIRKREHLIYWASETTRGEFTAAYHLEWFFCFYNKSSANMQPCKYLHRQQSRNVNKVLSIFL